MVISIIVAIIVITASLAAFGVYIVVHGSNREKDTELSSKIAVSGKYAAAMLPIEDALAEKKPNEEEIKEWLKSQNVSEEKIEELLKSWKNSIDETVKTINDGDTNGITTYRIAFGPFDEKVCPFLNKDQFLTRVQLNSNAELLPPYYPGSDSKVIPKHAWDNPDVAGGWQSVLPKDGKYEVPDWKRVI